MIHLFYISVCVSVQHCAVVHHQRRLLSAALNKWRDNWRCRVVSAEQYVLAETHHTHKSIRHTWITWIEVYTAHCTIFFTSMHFSLVCEETKREKGKVHTRHHPLPHSATAESIERMAGVFYSTIGVKYLFHLCAPCKGPPLSLSEEEGEEK